jgi:hypothetical protein
MTGFADIQSALMTAWADVDLDYATSYEGVDYQGLAFIPPNDAPWVALTTLPASTMPAALGANAPLEHIGLLQVDLNYPLNTSAGAIRADADTVAASLTPGTVFTFNTQRILIARCERSSIRRSDAYKTLSLTVRWRGL